jgi:hypothetical protein
LSGDLPTENLIAFRRLLAELLKSNVAVIVTAVGRQPVRLRKRLLQFHRDGAG